MYRAGIAGSRRTGMGWAGAFAPAEFVRRRPVPGDGDRARERVRPVLWSRRGHR